MKIRNKRRPEAPTPDFGKEPGFAGPTSIFFGYWKKIIFSVILLICAAASFGPLAEWQGRGHVDKALQASSADGPVKEERIQSALTKKSKQILAVWVAMKGVNGLINLLQSVETGGSLGVQISVNPAEILAPLDNTLDKISNILLWALGAVLFEKLLLAVSGYVVFKFIIPACLLLSVFAIWFSNGRAIGRLFAVTILICAVIRFAVPVSFEVSTAMENNLLSSEVERTVKRIEEKKKTAEDEQAGQQDEKDENFLAKAKNFAVGLTERVSNVRNLGNALIEDMINFIMVFILTNIVTPVLTLLGLYWFTRYLARVIMGSGLWLENRRFESLKYNNNIEGTPPLRGEP